MEIIGILEKVGKDFYLLLKEVIIEILNNEILHIALFLISFSIIFIAPFLGLSPDLTLFIKNYYSIFAFAFFFSFLMLFAKALGEFYLYITVNKYIKVLTPEEELILKQFFNNENKKVYTTAYLNFDDQYVATLFNNQIIKLVSFGDFSPTKLVNEGRVRLHLFSLNKSVAKQLQKRFTQTNNT